MIIGIGIGIFINGMSGGSFIPGNALQTDAPESQVIMTDDNDILTMDI